MNNKQQILTTLQEEFNRWEALLASMSEEQITAPQLAANWSVKDVIAHLWAWQQRSIARLEAALYNRQPEFPQWPTEFDPEVEGEPDQLNAWLYQAYREKPWPRVYEDWREGCRRFLDLGEKISEKDLLAQGRYVWLEGEPLSSVLRASYEHYEEHRQWLFPRIQQGETLEIGRR
jgi:hypothetical protein